MSLEGARRLADTVLYEGYLLYPYRASARKNQVRWQFGTFVPRGYAADGAEPWALQTECLVEPAAEPRAVRLRAVLRFLQLQHRQVEAAGPDGGPLRPVERLERDGEQWLSWDEGVEREVELEWPLATLLAGERSLPVAVAAGREVEELPPAAGVARLVRRRWLIEAAVRTSAIADGRLVRVRLRVENLTPWRPAEAGAAGEQGLSPRDAALRRSLLGAHLLLAVDGGAFVSLLDPPEWAAPAAAACVQEQALPVLVGEPPARDVMLASPILLYDYPAIAPESPENLCDGTEIDEILTLRVMTMTEAEKAEARATDPRARRIVDHADGMPPELLERLHGVMRELRPAAPAEPHGGLALPVFRTPGESESESASVEEQATEGPASVWERFLNPPGEAAPQAARCEIAGVAVGRGSRVRIHPRRNADAMDFFLAGRVGRVEGVFRDLEDRVHVALTVADDPAGELHSWFGRYFYFATDELEPLGPGEDGAAAGPGGPAGREQASGSPERRLS